MRIPLSEFLAYIVGAGVVYTFFTFLDVISGDGFNWLFFFMFWDIQFMLILILHKAYEIKGINR